MKLIMKLCVVVIVIAVIAGTFFALHCNPHGLRPGDVYSQGLDVDRNETIAGIHLLTVYGNDVIASPSLLRKAKLGPRKPRMYLAVVLPEGAGRPKQHCDKDVDLGIQWPKTRGANSDPILSTL